LTTKSQDVNKVIGKFKKYSYRIRRNGVIYRVLLNIGEKKDEESGSAVRRDFEGYLTKYNGLFLFFSNENVDDIKKYLMNRFLQREKNIYYMWIPKKIIENLVKEFEEKYENILIKKFISERDLLDKTEAYFRGDVERRIEYRGDDGLEVLKEMKYYYGVRPYNLEIEILDNCAFKINKEGFFAYDHGDLLFLINIVEKVFKKIKKILDLTKRSEFREKSLLDLKFKTLKLQPIVVDFSTFKLNIDTYEDFSRILKKHGFELYNTLKEAGSIKLHSKIIDSNKKAIFNISSGGTQLIITPQYKTTFDSLFRLLEVISEKIDSEIHYSLYKRESIIQELT
jgi:hypothetical protein